MSWSDAQLEGLRSDIVGMKVREFTHKRASVWYWMIDIMLDSPAAILMAIGGSTALASTEYNGVVSGLSLAAIVLLAVRRTLNSEKMSASHLSVARQCEVLARDASRVLRMDNKPNADEYLKELYMRYDPITESAPTVPSVITKQYEQDIEKETAQVAVIVNRGGRRQDPPVRPRVARRPSNDFYATAERQDEAKRLDILVEKIVERGSGGSATSLDMVPEEE